jgi:serine/threonine-protein kinase ATR
MRPPPLPNASVTQLSQQLAPPSSIAAIVSNFQKDGEGEGNAFNQLLAEVMGPDFSSSGDVDTATHYKLLQIITGAGLTVLLSNDPFAQVDSQLRSASISLVVMKLTIERTPEVLFMPPPPDASQPENAFMYIWLFSQLFPLLGHPRSRTKLVGELLAAMEAMFFAAASLPRAWKHLKTMAAYCRACLNCECMLYLVCSLEITVKNPADGVCVCECKRHRFRIPKHNHSQGHAVELVQIGATNGFYGRGER